MCIKKIKELIGYNKKISVLSTPDLHKKNGEKEQLKTNLTDKENQPLTDKTIIFTINGREYSKTTNKDGVAVLNINLNPGEYVSLIKFNGDKEYRACTDSNKIRVSPVINIKNLTIIRGERLIIQLTDTLNNPVSNCYCSILC